MPRRAALAATIAAALSASMLHACPPEAAAAASSNSPDAPATEPARSACSEEQLQGTFQRLLRDGGSGTGGDADAAGLINFYRRLGCSDEQINTALRQAAPSRGDGGIDPALTSPPDVRVLGAELAAFAVAALGVRVWDERPRGWVRTDLVEPRTSSIAGRGLFARTDVASGTVLGAYPGRLRTPQEVEDKAMAAPGTKMYVFATDDGEFLDPTDAKGTGPDPFPSPGLWWPFAVQVDLAFVNEPPQGSGGPNCAIENGSEASELLFVATRDLVAGEEVLIDYGPNYNRSRYSA